MSKLWRSKYLRGFTLIELLVVIAIIAILAAILVPAVTDALLRGRLTQVMSNGKNIYTALFAQEMADAVFMKSTPYPNASNASMIFDNSTEYFRWVVTNSVMTVNFGFFAGPGIGAAEDVASFSATNNAWCIVEGISESSPDGTPILFTRNLRIDTIGDSQVLSESSGGTPNIEAIMPALRNSTDPNTPFLDKAMVVVFKGGAAMSLRKNDVVDNFNKTTSGTNNAPLNNPVLRPGDGGKLAGGF